MMLEKINLEKVLFLDIETVPEVYSFEDLDPETAELYSKKTQFFQKEGQTAADVYDRAGIYAEFGKIVCISCGFVRETRTGKTIRMKSFYGDDEEQLLLDFKRLLDDNFSTPYHILCGHNAKEFDFPFIARRMLIHGISLPNALDIAGKKPWEIAHLDTLELWKFGDYKHYTRLELLATLFDIPSSKGDIDGSQVNEAYYVGNDFEGITKYCLKDVEVTARIYLSFQGISSDVEVINLDELT